uniref:Protein kinase domain-containing protein n=1 Tax=Arcella intermedia TaxID=1963864 RepID=A0A6B2L6L5_9EUKA
MESRLGSGSYSVVFKATSRRTREPFAIRKIYDGLRFQMDRTLTLRELFILTELNHFNIISLIQMYRPSLKNDAYVVYEFVEADLDAVLRARILEDVHKVYVFYQLLKAIKYIHSAGIVHNNLKPSNILINSECIIKVADFAHARFFGDVKEVDTGMFQYVEPRWYISPEVLLGCTYFSKEMDIWSLGCIFGEMLLGKKLFPGTSTINQIDRIFEITGMPSKEDLLDIPSQYAEALIESLPFPQKRSFKKELCGCLPETRKLLKRFLVFNPAKRILIDEALVHPYVSQFFDVKEMKTRSPLKSPFDTSKMSSLQYGNELFDTFKKNCLNRQRFIDWPMIHQLLPPKKQEMVEEFLLVLQIFCKVPKDLSIILIQTTLIYLMYN